MSDQAVSYYHVRDGDDHYVAKDHPIQGETVGKYPTAGDAAYAARVLNHRTGHPVLDEFEAMYQSEIDFLLVGMWDGGIEWYLGNGPSVEAMVDQARERGTYGNAKTLEMALVDMTNAARRLFSDSAFARPRPTDIGPAREPFEWLVERATKEFPGFALIHTPSNDPYESQWTAEPTESDMGYGGSTPYEAVAHMLDEARKAEVT